MFVCFVFLIEFLGFHLCVVFVDIIVFFSYPECSRLVPVFPLFATFILPYCFTTSYIFCSYVRVYAMRIFFFLATGSITFCLAKHVCVSE